MAVQLYINNTEQTNYILDTPFKDTIDEELDHLNFQVKSSTRLTFKKGDRVRYVIKHSSTTKIDKIFCLFECVETLGGSLWTYQISCLSPTKLLENIIVNGMCETYYTQPNHLGTLYNQFVRIVDKINAQGGFEHSNYVRLTIDSTSINSTTLNQSAMDFLWNGQMTAREILNDILEKADYLVIGKDFSTSGDYVFSIQLAMVKREKQGTEILISGSDVPDALVPLQDIVTGLQYNRDNEYNCGNIISLMKNGIAKDSIQQAFMPPRNSDLSVDDASTWHIITQEPIYSLNSVKMIVPCQADSTDSLSTSECLLVEGVDENGNPDDFSAISHTQIYGKIVDITNYIVEKSVFDAMSLDDQKTHLYFIRGQKGIFGLYTRYKWTTLNTHTALFNIIETKLPSAINSGFIISNGVLLQDNPFLYFYQASGESERNWHTTGGSLNGTLKDGAWQQYNIYSLKLKKLGTSWSPDTREDMYKQCLFSINYQPYCDSVVKVEKTSLDNSKAKNLSIMKNQSNRTIDAEKYFSSQQSLIERLGNEEMILDCMIDLETTYSYTKSVYDLGDYFTLSSGKWTITQREIKMFGINKIMARYKLSKNFNSSNANIQLNRDKRLYGIPLDNYIDRYIIIKKNASILSNYDKAFIPCYDDFTDAPNVIDGYAIAELVKVGNSSVYHKVVRCMDNQSVDIGRTKSGSVIVNVNLRYGDVDGYAQNLSIYLMTNSTFNNNVQINDYSRLPFIPSSEISSVISSYAIASILTNIYKDKMERLIFVFVQ